MDSDKLSPMFYKIQKLWPVFLLLIVIFAFFSKLFFPPSIFVTPDFGRSDLIHFNIPIRLSMAQSLKNFELPLWEPRIGQGFPLFNEGQMGLFYPPNTILFALLPFWLAFNLGYLFTFLLAATGTYLFARSLNISKSGATMAALTFAFCPMMVLQIQHYNLIQSLSLVPWVLYLINEFFKEGKLRYLLFLSILTALQVFAGFQQITAYSLFVGTIFFIFKLTSTKSNVKFKFKKFLLFNFFIILGLTISAIQVAASFELSKEAKRTNIITPQSILREYPYKPVNLLTIFNPYLQGNPREGTYPEFQSGKWGIFWENTTYFGLVQLILVLAISAATLIKPRKEKNRHLVIFFIGLSVIGLMLSLGSSAPLHPIFSLPPFSLFRVPSRFLMFLFLSASILAGLSLDKIIRKKYSPLKFILISGIIFLVIIDIFRLWLNYHQVEKKEEVFKPSIFASKIDKESRIFSYGIEEVWTEEFIEHGWKDNYAFYHFLINSLAQNSNILSNISHQSSYGGIIPRRSAIIISLLKESFRAKNGSLTIDKKGEKIMDANNIKYLVTTKTLVSDNWKLIDSLNFDEHILYLWKNPEDLSRAYIASDFEIVTTIPEFIQTIEKEDNDINKKVVLEEKLADFPLGTQNEQGTAKITRDENRQVDLATQLKEKSLVVLSDSYYPGWKAYIDGVETKIYAANINSRAVVAPAGDHNIEYRYRPKNIQIGALISISSIIVLIGIFKFLKIKKVY